MIDWKPLLTLLESAGPFVLTTHVNPDGDALGSELALFHWLRSRGRPVRIVNSDPVPERYRFLDPAGHCEPYQPAVHHEVITTAAVVILLDVARWDRLGDLGAAVDESRARRACIDHHPPEEPVPADVVITDATAAATGELLFECLSAAGADCDRQVAQALYVAIMTDTGSFRFSNTTARTHRITAALLRHPLDTAGLYEAAYGRSSEARLRLLGDALTGMEILAEGAVVVLTIPAESLARHRATATDTEGFAELARGTNGCLAAAVFTETDVDQVKVSLRSRDPVDVNRVARVFGGGGHARAAGIAATGSLREVRARVLAELVKATGESANP